MKTDPVYMLDPYKKELETEVLEVIQDKPGEYRVILKDTVFYPMGGGQPTDQGKLITSDGEELEVYEVLIKDGEINHFVRSEVELTPGDKIKAEIDWPRRYKNMKIHTAGHIIDFALHMLGYVPDKLIPTKGNHGKKPSVVYEGKTGDIEPFKGELRAKIEEIIKDNLEFEWEFASLDELEKEAIYLMPNLPTNKPLRILRLKGVGAVADGGTIAKNADEVGGVEIVDVLKNGGQIEIKYQLKEEETEKKTKTKVKAQKVELNSDLQAILQQAADAINNSKTEEELTNLWREYLGKKGKIRELYAKIGEIPAEERKSYGQGLNQLKEQIDGLISKAKSGLRSSSDDSYLSESQAELGHSQKKIGHLHPLTETINELNEIFRTLGYSVYDGPEIETDEYLFQKTNLPVDHPARDLQDSIYIESPNILLRTQTSSVETHALEELEPPFKIVVPGRTYRNEKVTKMNGAMFHQYQLVCVQEKVSLSELIATIEYAFKNFIGDHVVTRYRNKYYPEVEPGLGPDMRCPICEGKALTERQECGFCKNRGWVEMAGAGIIHPNMFRMTGLDPDKWQGFAFGFGLDRWAMAKHGIEDIRTLLSGNLAYRPFVG